MEFTYYSAILISPVIIGQVVKDMLLAVGSLLFIIIFMCFQTGSMFITFLTIVSIIAAFCTANLIYRIVFDYVYFGIFHVLAIFIILGIGADDVFVFMDTWKETGHHKDPTLGHRMSDAYRKAAMAMLFTSLTTAIAFIVSAASPFLAIGSFGLFSAILILVNYLSVILFLPCVVIIYHLYFEKYK
jgi:predicted RND superfamily exporter protein